MLLAAMEEEEGVPTYFHQNPALNDGYGHPIPGAPVPAAPAPAEGDPDAPAGAPAPATSTAIVVQTSPECPIPEPAPWEPACVSSSARVEKTRRLVHFWANSVAVRPRAPFCFFYTLTH